MKSIRTLGENENNKYKGILEVDTIKQTEMKEKVRKKTSEEQEDFSKTNSAGEISSKG